MTELRQTSEREKLITWCGGILATLMTAGIISLISNASAMAARVAVVETKTDGVEARLIRIESKLDRLLEGSGR